MSKACTAKDGSPINMREDQRAVLYINIIGGVALIIGGLWCATQWTAHQLDYQPRLGPPWIALGDLRVYVPWRFFQWDYYYGEYARGLFFKGYLWIYGAFFAELLMFVYLAVWRAKNKQSGDAYGTARWANERDLKRAGLLDGEGIVLGQTPDGQLIAHNGPEHALMFAPPRSGKGVGVVIPTLLCWPGSTLVLDLKRENWEITAGFRKRFSRVIRFEPYARDSAHYNPLYEIRKGDNEFRDTQIVAEMIMSTGDPHPRADHWERTGKALLIAAILHVLYAERDKSLPGVTEFLSNPGRSEHDTLERMLHFPHRGAAGPHPVIAGMTREVIDKAENELSGVFSTARSFLTLYRDPIIASNLRSSDFSIADLMRNEHPVSLYLTSSESELQTLKPLLRLMLNQIGKRLTESLTPHSDTAAHRLLLLLDEFPQLGQMEFLEKQLAFLPGYGIRALLIAQSLNQLEASYGPAHSILDTSQIRITHGSNDDKTAKRISELLGQATQIRKQANYAGSRLSPFLMHVMVSEQESPRPLLTAGEILSLPNNVSIIMAGNLSPYYGRKVTYYDNPLFMHRANSAGHEVPPPRTRAELAGEYPPRTPSAWEAMPDRTLFSHASAVPRADDGQHERDPAVANPLSEDVGASALELERARAEREAREPARETTELDEDREDAQRREQRRVQQLRTRQRAAELERQPGQGELPL